MGKYLFSNMQFAKNMRSFPKLGKTLISVYEISQFRVAFIMPLLVCIGICWWLSGLPGIGGWIFIPGIFFGLGGCAMTVYRLYLSVMRHQGKETARVSYNRHI